MSTVSGPEDTVLEVALPLGNLHLETVAHVTQCGKAWGERGQQREKTLKPAWLSEEVLQRGQACSASRRQVGVSQVVTLKETHIISDD